MSHEKNSKMYSLIVGNNFSDRLFVQIKMHERFSLLIKGKHKQDNAKDEKHVPHMGYSMSRIWGTEA